MEAKLATLYGKQEPQHWGTVQRYSEGGKDPLDGVSAYRADNPHFWHYISFGFSETHDKKSKNPDVSGWGFELSFRLKPAPGETAAPLWPVMMLQNLARYVFSNGSPFDHEHYIAWGRPITTHVPTNLVATVFRDDPQLGTIMTPNGSLKFLEAIGITQDEHDLVAAQGADKLFPTLLKDNPLGITDPGRSSLLRAA
jgi:hypothetical protein